MFSVPTLLSMIVAGPHGWYVSRQGSQINYWSGAPVNSRKCASGTTNSCVAKVNCNCNINDNKGGEDSGYLTDKNTLPVTELRLSDTGDSYEIGYHTLGNVRIRIKDRTLCTTVRDLKIIT